jgi:hypothetical protein
MKLAVLSVLLVLVGCSDKESSKVVADYSVNKPSKNKHHAVFQIRAQNGGGCTAFVISNRIAVTAGHCVEISKSTIANKKEILLEARGFVRDMGEAIRSIDCSSPEMLSRMPRFVCDRELRGMRRRIKSAAEFADRLSKDKPDEFKVINSEGKELAIKPIAVDHENSYRDFAILSGDFSEFEKVSLVKDLNLLPGDKLRTCGFANLKIPATCTNFIAEGNSGFAYAGNGYLVKGMSGGPVFNSNGEVVGINVAVSNNQVMITPVVGIKDVLSKEE